ncbi:MAG: hypothetical protein BV458_10075 [Thermoplasmata archaeon M9B2D]|nr:MAG: hypothetical protein BV458_10075 [Thermoplasmata archaeon M9B2D]
MIKKKGCFVSMLVLFFLFSVPAVPSEFSLRAPQTMNDEGWYFLPAYPNYAPHGLPDFDQQQDNWKARQGIWRFVGGLWSFCGPTCVADIFWWFDSKHEDPGGFPGDGVDAYPLVRDYTTVGSPTPGPTSDDHNFNNVNDILTPWKQGRGAKELIETIAWYCNTNFCRYPFIRGFAGTFPEYLEEGVRQYIQDAGLQSHYSIEAVRKPTFSQIVEKLHNDSGIIINFLFYNSNAVFFPTFLGHYVAVAGINPNGFIALCDPFQNIANPYSTPLEHNNAGIVSYDIYPVNYSSPFPEKASWWIEQYFSFGPKKLAGIAVYALILSEIV